jgi:hypothetical protein
MPCQAASFEVERKAAGVAIVLVALCCHVASSSPPARVNEGATSTHYSFSSLATTHFDFILDADLNDTFLWTGALWARFGDSNGLYHIIAAEGHQWGETLVYVQADSLPPVQLLQLRNGEGHQRMVLPLDAPAGLIDVVLLSAADGRLTNVSFSYVASKSPKLLSQSNGKAFLSRESDFQGDLNVHVADVHVASGVRLLQNAAGSLFAGFVGSSNVGVLNMSVHGPGLSLTGDNVYFLNGTSPGTYSFEIAKHLDVPVPCLEGIDVLHVLCTPQPVWVFGADVTS